MFFFFFFIDAAADAAAVVIFVVDVSINLFIIATVIIIIVMLINGIYNILSFEITVSDFSECQWVSQCVLAHFLLPSFFCCLFFYMSDGCLFHLHYLHCHTNDMCISGFETYVLQMASGILLHLFFVIIDLWWQSMIALAQNIKIQTTLANCLFLQRKNY